jgi:hypothetical protein
MDTSALEMTIWRLLRGAWVAGHKSRVPRKGHFFVNRVYVFISLNYELVPARTDEQQLEVLDAARAGEARTISA